MLRLQGASDGADGSGSGAVAYTSAETPMVPFVNTHAQLEAMRDRAAAQATAAALSAVKHTGDDEGAASASSASASASSDAMDVDAAAGGVKAEGVKAEGGSDGGGGQTAAGPRVLVVGPADSGKSSPPAILTAYAVRVGRTPVYVDLDVSNGELSVPGSISAAPMDGTDGMGALL